MFARLLFSGRWPLIAGLLAVVGYLTVEKLPDLRFDLSFTPLMEAEPGKRSAVMQEERSYRGSLPEIVLVATWPDLVRAEQLEVFEALRRSVTALDSVRGTAGLTDLPAFSLRAEDDLLDFLGEVMPEVPLRDLVDLTPDVGGRFLSEDGCSLVMWVLPKRRGQVKADLERVLPKGTHPEVVWRIMGPPLVLEDMRAAMQRDIKVTIAVQVLLLLVVLPIVFRTLRGGIVPVFSLLVAVCLYLGGLAWTGFGLSVLGVAIPGLMAVIVVCDSIHLMHRFEESLQAGRSRRASVGDMLRDTGPACFWTSATTALGFASLMVADHAAVRSFGAVAAAGVGVAFLVVILFTPALLAVWPVRHRARLSEGGGWLGLVGRRGVLPGCGLAMFLLLLGLSQLRVNNRLLGELPARSEAVENFTWYEANVGGLCRLQFDVEGDLLDPEGFAAVRRFVDEFMAEPDVLQVEAYTEYLALFSNPEPNREDLFVASNILLGSGRFPRHVLQPDVDAGRIIFFTRDVGSSRFLEMTKTAKASFDTLPGSLSAGPSGYAAVAYEGVTLVVSTLARSLGLSFFVITVVIALAFRSWRMGLISLPPNLLPILAGLGVAGWLGIELRIGVVVVFCIGFGLAVDDTIHFLSRYRVMRRSGATVADAHRITLETTGHALLQTSVVLGIGGLSYFAASFQSLRDTGALLITMIVVALVADLVLLPRLLKQTEER